MNTGISEILQEYNMFFASFSRPGPELQLESIRKHAEFMYVSHMIPPSRTWEVLNSRRNSVCFFMLLPPGAGMAAQEHHKQAQFVYVSHMIPPSSTWEVLDSRRNSISVYMLLLCKIMKLSKIMKLHPKEVKPG